MSERDFDTNPYSPDEQRVADWLFKRTKGIVGTGDDPIGFVLASYELVHNQMTAASRALKRAQAVMRGVQDVAPTPPMEEAIAIVRDALRGE